VDLTPARTSQETTGGNSSTEPGTTIWRRPHFVRFAGPAKAPRTWKAAVADYCRGREADLVTPSYRKRTRATLEKVGEALEEAGLSCTPRNFGIRQADFVTRQLWPTASDRGPGFAGSTIRFRCFILNRFLSFYGGERTVGPAIRISHLQSLRRSSSFQRRALSQAEARNLLRAARRLGPFQGMMVALELSMGLRRSEVLRLKVENISREPASILGKGILGGRWREVPRSGLVVSLLPSVLEHRARVIQAAKGPDPGFLICHVIGGRTSPYSPSWTDTQCMVPAFKKAKLALPGNLHHALRRTFGRTLWQRGVPIETVGSLLGHQLLATTLLYLALDVEDKRLAVDALNGVFTMGGKLANNRIHRERGTGPTRLLGLRDSWQAGH
jgi:integrase